MCVGRVQLTKNMEAEITKVIQSSRTYKGSSIPDMWSILNVNKTEKADGCKAEKRYCTFMEDGAV